MLAINGSVGLGGQNSPSDVYAIQNALNASPLVTEKIKPDYKFGPKTLRAILQFQLSAFQNPNSVDGRVDPLPQGKTLKLLSDPKLVIGKKVVPISQVDLFLRKLPAVPTGQAPSVVTKTAARTKSGVYWVTWADAHAKTSTSVETLVEPFKANAKAFIKALEDAGAKVVVGATFRSPKRAYLFHWSWKIGLGKAKPSDATAMAGVDIEWDHGDADKSKKAAREMIDGFDLAVPPESTNAPALSSNHTRGTAVDMKITWAGTIKVKKKDGKEESITFMSNVNSNTKLHAVGESYGVKKLVTDAPHWSANGR